MPGRLKPIVTGNYYHIYNRGVAKLPIFNTSADYKRIIDIIQYYRFEVPISYSAFIDLIEAERQKIWQKVKSQNNLLVKIHTFALMPNHFHFTLYQCRDRGIQKFIGNVSNSYTKYFNIKNDRVGPLFQGRFKAKHISNEQQLKHLSRYHHLNIYAAGMVKNFKKLLRYPYSSLPDYLGKKIHEFVDTETVMSLFKNIQAYEKFVLSHADYQRKLNIIKKLLF